MRYREDTSSASADRFRRLLKDSRGTPRAKARPYRRGPVVGCRRCYDEGCQACDWSTQRWWLRFSSAWGRVGLQFFVKEWWMVVAQGRAESETQE